MMTTTMMNRSHEPAAANTLPIMFSFSFKKYSQSVYKAGDRIAQFIVEGERASVRVTSAAVVWVLIMSSTRACLAPLSAFVPATRCSHVISIALPPLFMRFHAVIAMLDVEEATPPPPPTPLPPPPPPPSFNPPGRRSRQHITRRRRLWLNGGLEHPVSKLFSVMIMGLVPFLLL
jgi:hypothetical protein